MATGVNGIATWGDINSAFGTSGSPSNKCPTKAEILATGKVEVPSRYLTTQLVIFRDLTPATITLTISVGSSSLDWYEATVNGFINDQHVSFSIGTFPGIAMYESFFVSKPASLNLTVTGWYRDSEYGTTRVGSAFPNTLTGANITTSKNYYIDVGEIPQ